MDQIKAIFGGKSPFKSLTFWGVALATAGASIATDACSQGILSADTCAIVSAWTTKLGYALTAFGLRKAAAENKPAA